MIGQRLGPYRIESELGSGGMGTVYRATGPDGPVAIKIVHPHLLDSPGFFRRFLREAEIGKKVDHPNVVRTLDCDALGSHHFLVTEYVEGKSLRALLTDLGTVPESLLREIALQVAAGLAAIHEAGIVHRDLKPENILIADDHEIRIMDLGVAKLLEATIALTREGQFAGSLLYAAPEQFGPEDVGPSADLYSLGVLLYELATGDHPFRRDDAAQVIEAQLKHEPPWITDLNTGATRFLAKLVATLLAKRPTERFESARVLHSVLANAERSRWWMELAPKLERTVAHLPGIRVPRETELHGRDADLDTLNEAWEKAKDGKGNTVFLEGEAGIGKTRLVDAFLRNLKDEDTHLLYGSYPPSGGMGGISDAIIEKFGEAHLAAALSRYLTVTPSLIPTFAALVRREGPPTGTRPMQGDALHAVCVHLMRALAEEKPTVWIVEDLHFASKEARGVVLALARAVEGHRVLLLPTARPGVPGDELAAFSRLENYGHLSLGRLGAREVLELLEEAFKSELLAEELGGRIAKKSDGVPFFLFEMIRGLREGQFIQRRPDGSYVQTQVIEEIEVPSAVKDLIEGRLRGIPDDDREILDVGSVQGVEFGSDLVADVLGLRRVQVLRRLAVLERRFGLVHGAGGGCRFDQNQVQEVLYQDLMPDLRVEYHTLLADAYARRLENEPSGEDAAFLASHHLRGGRPVDGLPHLTPALDRLAETYRNEDAIELTARALEKRGLLDGTERARVLLQKVGRHDLGGERELQSAALDEALALADESGSPSLRARVRCELGWHRMTVSDYAAAQEWLEQALDLARSANDRSVESAAVRNLGNVFRSQGRYEEARASFEQSLALSRELGDRVGEARDRGGLGTAFWTQGHLEEARAQFEKAIALARETGDRDTEAAIALHLGILLADQGRDEDAVASFEKSRSIARGCGNRRCVADAMGNSGLVLLGQGRVEEARAHLEGALALYREIANRAGEARTTGSLGSVFLREGRYDEARASIERWRALAREIGNRVGESRATARLGIVSKNQGRYEEARAQFKQRLELAREIGDREGEAFMLVSLGALQATLGQSETARETLGESLGLLREIGVRQPEGYALHQLGNLSERRGDAEDARRCYEKALASRRKLSDTSGVASTLLALGRLDASRGNERAAAARFEEALAMSRDLKVAGTILPANVEHARLHGGDIEVTLTALKEHEDHADHETKMNARLRLWELTSDDEHLHEAKRLLDFAVEHSPEEYRTSMLDNVPLHRDIVQAWEEHGADSDPMATDR